MRNFEHTVNVLVQAYLNDTLEHRNCTACAVGNIIAECTGTKPLKFINQKADDLMRWENGINPSWISVFVTPHTQARQKKYPENYVNEAKSEIDSTGYTWEELAKIEEVFEHSEGMNSEDRMFDGLMNVVDVLADIHGIDLKAKEEAKQLFVKCTV